MNKFTVTYATLVFVGAIKVNNNRGEIPDSYTVHNDALSASIKSTHKAAESARQAAIDAQEAADAWRAWFTPSPPRYSPSLA